MAVSLAAQKPSLPFWSGLECLVALDPPCKQRMSAVTVSFCTPDLGRKAAGKWFQEFCFGSGLVQAGMLNPICCRVRLRRRTRMMIGHYFLSVT
jgi:hypothetical protein